MCPICHNPLDQYPSTKSMLYSAFLFPYVLFQDTFSHHDSFGLSWMCHFLRLFWLTTLTDKSLNWDLMSASSQGGGVCLREEDQRESALLLHHIKGTPWRGSSAMLTSIGWVMFVGSSLKSYFSPLSTLHSLEELLQPTPKKWGLHSPPWRLSTEITYDFV